MDNVNNNINNDIAIVGMACRFPKTNTLDAFWKLCLSGDCSITEVPKERWDLEQWYDENPDTAGKIYSRWGGFLENLKEFDASFFSISPREANHVDPRQRLMLELSWEALEDAGIRPSTLSGSQTSFYIATLTDDYADFVFSDPHRVEPYSGMGTAHSIIANRLSYFYDCHGPSLTLDTACSGSLVGLHLARQSLLQNESDMALVGGVNVILTPNSTLFFSRTGALSPTGCSRTFDANADGFVRSEGAGFIVIKKLAKALQDNDRIYAVIKGSAVNQDGKTDGIMCPSSAAQKAVLSKAYESADIHPSTVQYVEAHGTGTKIGDLVELTALASILSRDPQSKKCFLGSVKANIGHTEAAAGIAGIIKTALMIFHKTIPVLPHFQTLNPAINLEEIPLQIPKSTIAWDWTSERIAGVSAFGFGGTNAHIVLTDVAKQQRASFSTSILPLQLSAKSLSSLKQYTRHFISYLKNSSDNIQLIRENTAYRRDHFKHRLAVVGNNKLDVVDALDAFLADTEHPLLFYQKNFEKKPLAFIYSGQGSYWTDMVNDLMAAPAFAITWNTCDAITTNTAGFSITALLNSNPDTIIDPLFAQVAIVSFQISLTNWLYDQGINPDVVMGQSVGEISAAYASGAISLEQALQIVIVRSQLMSTLNGQGCTAQINLPPEDVYQILQKFSGDVTIAGQTSRTSCLISGTYQAIEECIEIALEREVFCMKINGVDISLHSPKMEKLRQPMLDALIDISPQPNQIPMVSTVSCKFIEGEQLNAEYWADNLIQPFNLVNSMKLIMEKNNYHFIEISPHPLLQRALNEFARMASTEVRVLATSKRNTKNSVSLQITIAELFQCGYSTNCKVPPPIIDLPKYAWARNYFWMSIKSISTEPIDIPVLCLANQPQITIYQYTISLIKQPFFADHVIRQQILLPGASILDIAAEVISQLDHQFILCFKKIIFLNPVELSSYETLIQCHYNDISASLEMYATRNKKDFTQIAALQLTKTPNFVSSLSLESAKRICGQQINPTQFDEIMQARGFYYGKHFKQLYNIHYGNGMAMATLDVHEKHDHFVFSCILDGLFQLTSCTLLDVAIQHDLIPYSLENINATKLAIGTYFAIAKLTEYTEQEYVFELLLLDEQHSPVITVERFILKAINTKPLCYQLQWQPYALPKSTVEYQNWLFISDDIQMVEECCRIMRDNQKYQHILMSSIKNFAWDTLHPATAIVFITKPLGNEEYSANTQHQIQLLVEVMQLSISYNLTLFIITRGAQAHLNQQINIADAALWGIGRLFMHEEHPQLAGLLLDLPSNHLDLPSGAKHIQSLLNSQQRGQQIIIRNDLYYQATLTPISVADHENQINLRVVLIAGGLGDLGLHTAQWCQQQGATHLILLSRSGAPDLSTQHFSIDQDANHLASQTISNLRHNGIIVDVVQLDITDNQSLLNYANHPDTPKVDTIIHAAGHLYNKRISEINPDEISAIFSVKLTGAQNLYDAFKHHPLKRFIVYSSLASLLPAIGQGLYASANCAQDAFIESLADTSLSAYSLQWGPWSAGMMRQTMVEKFYAARGVNTLTPATYTKLLTRVLSAAQNIITISDINWHAVGRHKLYSPPMIQALCGDNIATYDNNLFSNKIDRHVGTLPEIILQLTEIIGFILHIDKSMISPDESLIALGIDSMMALEIKNRIAANMQVEVDIAKLLGGSSITEIAELCKQALFENNNNIHHLFENGDKNLLAQLDEIESLSDQEVRDELEREDG